MSVQTISNTLTPQQIMQMLAQQNVGTADPNAAKADGTTAADPAGQNLPGDTSQPSDTATGGAQVAPAKTSLDPNTLKSLLMLQEQQSMASDDSLLFGSTSQTGGTGDPLLDALNNNSTTGTGADDQDAFTSLLDQLSPQMAQSQSANGAQDPLLQALSGQDTTNAGAAAQSVVTPGPADGSTLDTSQILSMLDSMNGSAQSGSTIASLTQQIMSFLDTGSDTSAGAVSDAGAALASSSATEE